MSIMSKRDCERLVPGIAHVPEALLQFSVECQHCLLRFKPDLLAKRKFPTEPVQAPNGWWVPITANVQCTICGRMTKIDLPRVDLKTNYLLCGDEAHRFNLHGSSEQLVTYTVAGINMGSVDSVESAVREFKKSKVPERHPDAWKIHMKELCAGDARQRHELYRQWPMEFVRAFVDDFAKLLRGLQPALFIANGSARYLVPSRKGARGPTDKRVRRDVYATFLLTVIDMMTRNGVSPELVFDAEKNCTRDSAIQQWTQDAFRSSKLCLLYPLLARGIHIPEPVTVKPASRPLLEIADFVGYLVARHLMRLRQDKIPEFPLENLGEIYFVAFDATARNINHGSYVGFPWVEDYRTPASRWLML